MERKRLLKKIVTLDGDLKSLHEELKKMSWDISAPIILINRDDILAVLNKVITGMINIDLIEEWANIIECREDINFTNEELQELIFELANPELYGKVTKDRIKELILHFKNG